VISKNHWTLHVIEFKWSSDRNEDSLGLKDDKANEQHKNVIEALKAAALEWTYKQTNFVAGRRVVVVEDNFYNKLVRLGVQAQNRDKILARVVYVQRICRAHDTVIQSYYQDIRGSSGADATSSRLKRILENKCMCKCLPIPLSPAADGR